MRAFTTEDPGECANYRRRVQAKKKRLKMILKSKDVGTGGITLPLARRPAAPTVQASWQGAGRDAAALELKISAANTASRAVLTIVGRDRRRTTTLHRARLEPDDAGAIARTIRLPIADWTRYVCVQAAFREPREHDPGAIRCPFRRGP